MSKRQKSLFDPKIVRAAIKDSFRKLDPRRMVRNPVMFVVYVGSFLTTGLFIQALVGRGEAPAGFILAVALWLWFTVLFANFAEAMAEGRGKAQAAALRQTRRTTAAKKLGEARFGAPRSEVSSTDLRKGDIVLVEAGDTIPGDGEVIEGAASVNEAAVTGESAPVIRESGGDRSSVTGGTQVLSDWLIIRITANPGETFLDRMIALVEGAKRQKTPNEIALSHPPRRAHPHLSHRDRHAAAVLDLQRHLGRRGLAGDRHGADGAPRLPDPDDDRRPSLRHRHCRHGPHDPGERHRHVRPRGGGGGRRRRAAARQDRHDHPGQPAGHRIPACRGDRRGAFRRRGPALVAGRRDPRRTQHRGARQGEIQDPRARHPYAGRPFRAVHRADAHERSGPERTQAPQRRCRRRRGVRHLSWRHVPGRCSQQGRDDRTLRRHASGGRRGGRRCSG